MRKYRQIGYYSDLEDIQNLIDKHPEDIVEEATNNRGKFYISDDGRPIDLALIEDAFSCRFTQDERYIIAVDFDWDYDEFMNLNPSDSIDLEVYEDNPAYIDVYKIVEEK